MDLSMSADGRCIVFVSSSPSLVGGEIDNAGPDVFVFDREARTIGLVSHMAGSATTTGDGLSLDPGDQRRRHGHRLHQLCR